MKTLILILALVATTRVRAQNAGNAGMQKPPEMSIKEIAQYHANHDTQDSTNNARRLQSRQRAEAYIAKRRQMDSVALHK